MALIWPANGRTYRSSPSAHTEFATHALRSQFPYNRARIFWRHHTTSLPLRQQARQSIKQNNINSQAWKAHSERSKSPRFEDEEEDVVEMFFPELREELRQTPVSLLVDKAAPVLKIEENNTVFDAVKCMSTADKGAILVTGSSSSDLVGIFTERDYFRKLILAGRSSPSTIIKDVMTNQVITVPPETSVDECGTIMAEHELRHLPVVDRKGAVLGMVSSKNIMQKMVQVSESFASIRDEFEAETVGDVFDWLGRDSSAEPFVSEEDTVYRALELMDKQNLPGVWVTKGDKLTGIFTERDYLKRVFVKNRHSRETLMGEVMSTDVVTVTHHESLLDTLRLMVKHKFRTLPVVPLLGNEISYGEKDVLVGMITAMDVIKFIHRFEEDFAGPDD